MGRLEAVKPWQTSQIQGVSGFGPLWLSLGMVSTHRAMVTMAKCTESRADMMV